MQFDLICSTPRIGPHVALPVKASIDVYHATKAIEIMHFRGGPSFSSRKVIVSLRVGDVPGPELVRPMPNSQECRYNRR